MTRLNSSAAHDRMVLQVAKHLKQRFYRNIRSRVGGFAQPEAIHINGSGYTPDVTVVNRDNVFHILEVETPEAFENGNGAGKWKAVSNYAAQHGATFYLVVPEEAKEKAKARVQDLNLHAKVWGLKKAVKVLEEE